MNRLTIVSPCVGKQDQASRLIESCRIKELPLVLFDGGQLAWHTVGSDTLMQYSIAPRVIAEVHTEFVLFTDAFDTFFCGDEPEILEKYFDTGFEVLYAAEQDVYPTSLHDDYIKGTEGMAELTTPWKAPNCGGFVGTREGVMRVLNFLRGSYTDIQEAQPRFIHAFKDWSLEGTGLDCQCSIFQTMSGSLGGSLEFHEAAGRPRNIFTGQYPSLIHFNGRSGQDGGLEAWYRKVYPVQQTEIQPIPESNG